MASAESRFRKSNSFSPSRLACLAGAATVLPFAAHADSIQYSGIQDITRTVGGDQASSISYMLEFVPVDMATDFQFNAAYDPIGELSEVYLIPQGTNAYLSGSTTAGSAPTALTAGALIDGSATYATGNGVLQVKNGITPITGPWPTDGSYAFLGITFTDPNIAAGTSPNGVYYGWVDLAVTANSINATFTIHDWAYNTTGNSIVAGQSTDTPEPSTLLLFALGAAGVAAVRARRLAARS